MGYEHQREEPERVNKMKINGVQCNQCNTITYLDPLMVGHMPSKWYTVTENNGEIGGDLHYCSLKCLRQWAVGLTVDFAPDYLPVADNPDVSWRLLNHKEG
jgi:hypothetical protein